MPPQTPYPPPEGMPPIVAVELNRVEGQCDGRHDRQNAATNSLKATVVKHDRKLVTLVDEDGKGGEVGRMKIDILDNETRSRGNEKCIAKLKSERRTQLAWSGGGAVAGGGSAFGIIEALRYFF